MEKTPFYLTFAERIRISLIVHRGGGGEWQEEEEEEVRKMAENGDHIDKQ